MPIPVILIIGVAAVVAIGVFSNRMQSRINTSLSEQEQKARNEQSRPNKSKKSG